MKKQYIQMQMEVVTLETAGQILAASAINAKSKVRSAGQEHGDFRMHNFDDDNTFVTEWDQI